MKGEADFNPGVPESFNVLVRELQSLCLDVDLLKEDSEAIGDGTGRPVVMSGSVVDS